MYAFKKRLEFYFYTICGKSKCQLQNFENMLMNSIGLKFKIKADCQDRFNSLFRFSMVKFHFLSARSIPNFVLLSISIYLYLLKPTTFIYISIYLRTVMCIILYHLVHFMDLPYFLKKHY